MSKATDKAMALETLNKWLAPGDTVYCVLRHRSPSGMQRCISLFAMVDGAPHEIDYFAAKALGTKISAKHGGIVVTGCGMDMGFHLVYALSHTMFPQGFDCIGLDRRCPSCDHNNRNDRPRHPDGGYALRSRWL